MTIQLSYIGDKLRQQTFTVGGKPNAILVTDLNADGIPDIALSGGSSNQVWVLINNGDGTFQPIAGYTAYTPAQGSPFDANGNFAIKAADFNRDGIVDLAVTTKLGQVSILHGNGDGTFQTGQSFDIGGTAQVIGIGDFNGDGFPDIAAPVGLQTSVAINTEGEMLGDAVGFRVSPSASSVAGQATSVTITAIDASGNAVPDFRGTVHVTSSDPHATLPKFYTFSAADAGVHTFTNQVTLDKAGVDVITASNPRLASASGTINVTAGAAAGFSVAMPTQAVAGTPFNAVVSAVDQFGNVAPTYTGTVDFNSNDPRATLPASYVFSTADAGTHTFSMTLIQAMAYHPAGFSVLQPGILFPADGPMVTVSDDAHAALTGANGVTVNAGAMSRLAVIAIPATVSHTAIAGEAINVIANAFDVYGNIAAFPTGDVIHVSVSDPKAELPGDQTIVPPTPQFPSSNTTVEWANSTANAVYMTTAGNQTITVTDLTHPAVFGSTPITVFGATASSLAISFPSSAAAGTPTAMTVTALDQFGNTAGGYGGIIRFTSSDAAASLPADYAFTSADNGSHTFTVTLKTLGSQTISVVDFFNFNPALAASKMIMVNPGPAAVVAVTPIASTIAGVAQSFSVSLQDIAGDLLHNYTGTVQFSSTDVQAGLPASYTFSAADAGTHVFSATLKTAGTQSIRVQDSANPGLSGTIANIVVTSAAATHFVMTPPASAISGKSFTMTVAAVDAFGNVVTGYRGKVHMTDSVNAGLPSDYTFSASDAGVHTFSVTLSTVGSQILKLTDTTNSLLTGSVAILVSAPATGGGATGGGGGGAAGGGGGAAGGGGGGSGGGGGKAA
jgi:S-adenosylmethionine hydrolase